LPIANHPQQLHRQKVVEQRAQPSFAWLGDQRPVAGSSWLSEPKCWRLRPVGLFEASVVVLVVSRERAKPTGSSPSAKTSRK
jgi:hypothetical protein